MPNVNLDTSILQAALEGLERRREQLEEQIRYEPASRTPTRMPSKRLNAHQHRRSAEYQRRDASAWRKLCVGGGRRNEQPHRLRVERSAEEGCLRQADHRRARLMSRLGDAG
jgi:hypothetical protein